jgi:hypothetical protein
MKRVPWLTLVAIAVLVRSSVAHAQSSSAATETYVIRLADLVRVTAEANVEAARRAQIRAERPIDLWHAVDVIDAGLTSESESVAALAARVGVSAWQPRVTITNVDRMPTWFVLTSFAYELDGSALPATPAPSRLTPIFTGRLPVGPHHLVARAEYTGRGAGVFSYVSGYRFVVRNALPFTLVPGRSLQVRAVFEDPSAGQPAGLIVDERPRVRFETREQPLP